MGSSLFRWMCSLLQLPILKCFLGLNNPRYMWAVRPPTTHDDGAGVTASYMIGPYFFDGTVSGVTCIKCGIMLYQSQTTMGLCNRCHWSKSAPAHFSLTVCEFLNDSLTGQCIGWCCATSPLPLPWWPCSPNLSTPDNSLCMAVINIPFTKTGSCNKLYIHRKRELSHETRLPEIIPTTKHKLCDIVSCQYHWVQLQTLATMTSSPGLSCSQTWSNIVLQVLLIISAQTCVVIVQWKQQPKHRSPFRILVNCSEENPSYSSIYTLFLTLKELLCTDIASQIAAEMVPSPDPLCDLCCHYASKHLLPNSPQRNNCSQLAFPSLHNTLLIIIKCNPRCWFITVLLHVHCHTGLSSHKMQM